MADKALRKTPPQAQIMEFFPQNGPHRVILPESISAKDAGRWAEKFRSLEVQG
jgi:hypothetical protein